MAEEPGDDTALIIPVHLPAPLEDLRRLAVPDARLGLPAHATLLYPFAPRAELDDDLLGRVAAIVSAHDVFAFRLAGRGTWPNTLYASVEPGLPFRSLHEDLAAAFPAFPVYRGAFAFTPHVTIAEGPFARAVEVVRASAWESLPAVLLATSVDLVVRIADGWITWSRFELRGGETGRT